ncbi:fasciclin domain-containing protein [Streptomyces sp. NBC_00536]|uniref:fasciclin domain-containing protein n=1 Tax=Streptomyces sp. NBC_00536 TaxID=2975769 RepID=UPI002E812897|nr:fasciclin domain-containing protein [Streptomyces sp. NBC_00536]WUC79988.1 fasciclin domain-containing protein [Streptomyces sp. NBC_00536]
MSTLRFLRTALAVATAAILPFALAACSESGKDSAAGPAADSAGAVPTAPAVDGAPSTDKPFGPACAGVPATGAGSFDGMAKDPVATAASHNPALSTLVAAVKQAGLVDTLNNAKDLTVFAPTNEAFAKIPKADLDKVLADKAMLTKILTYHVVGQRLAPQQLESGSFDTLEKDQVTTAGSGTSYQVNGASHVVCGNVPTANATVYIVDTVLMPK